MIHWLTSFAEQAALSDQVRGRGNHVLLLAAGLYGEAGSVLAELKKSQGVSIRGRCELQRAETLFRDGFRGRRSGRTQGYSQGVCGVGSSER